MDTHRSTRPRRTRWWALLGLVALLAISVGAPAYAAKPSGPPAGQNGHTAQPTQTKAQAPAPTKAQPKATTHTKSGTTKATGSDHSSGNASTVGDPKQPQPFSHADQNNTGANDTSSTNQYRSTRHGEASGNGSGTGRAVGKPAAGSVGKADNKNPPGQFPNGSDHNNGYECDGNNGIAKENPAHTGCQPPTGTECTPLSPNYNPATGTCVPSGTECTPQSPGYNPATGTCTPPGPQCTPQSPNYNPATGTCSGTPTEVCTPQSPNWNPATQSCTPPIPGCVDNPSTPMDECSTVSPPTGCVDNPGTPMDECGSVVSPPGGGEQGGPPATSSSVSSPSSSTSSPSESVLPQTGAGAGVIWAGALGLLLLAGGAGVTARIRRRA